MTTSSDPGTPQPLFTYPLSLLLTTLPEAMQQAARESSEPRKGKEKSVRVFKRTISAVPKWRGRNQVDRGSEEDSSFGFRTSDLQAISIGLPSHNLPITPSTATSPGCIVTSANAPEIASTAADPTPEIDTEVVSLRSQNSVSSQPRECGICFGDNKNGREAFIDKNLSEHCQHEILPLHKLCILKLYGFGTLEDRTCIGPTCNQKISTERVLSFADTISDRISLLRRHSRWLSCPAEACGGGCVAPSMDYTQVVCIRCMAKICFQCKTKWHEDQNCEEVQAPLDLDGFDYVRSLMEKGNIKRCPGCPVLISKEGGCSHMQCKCARKLRLHALIHSVGHHCKAEFCWHCLQPWSRSYISNSHAVDCLLSTIASSVLAIALA
jgi:IBR domain, a half RING-finger domain